jgi:hypothetical protein
MWWMVDAVGSGCFEFDSSQHTWGDVSKSRAAVANLLLHGRGKPSKVSDERLSAKEEHNLPSE